VSASGSPPRDAAAIAISPLRRDELNRAASLLGRAFRDNAMNRVVAPGGELRRERSNVAGMRAVLPLAHARGVISAARSGDSLAGVRIALTPGVQTFGRPSWLALIRMLLVQGPGVAARWSAVAEALQLHRPLAPHAYLATLGVEPELQRSGVGRALVADWLRAVDALRQRAYLETDSTNNASWYERFGFAVRTELSVLGVTVYLMERGPRDA